MIGSEEDSDHRTLWVIIFLSVEVMRHINIFEAFPLKHKLVCWMFCEVIRGRVSVRCGECGVWLFVG